MRTTSFILLILTTCASIASAAPLVEAPPQGSTFPDPARDISGSGKFEQETDLLDDSSLSTRTLTGGEIAGIAAAVIVVVLATSKCALHPCICPNLYRHQPTLPVSRDTNVELAESQYIRVVVSPNNIVPCSSSGPPPPYNPGSPTVSYQQSSAQDPGRPPPAYDPRWHNTHSYSPH